jgi:voltage-gated potassium channel Kch
LKSIVSFVHKSSPHLELPTGFGLGEAEEPDAWGTILTASLVETPENVHDLWLERLGQFVEELRSAEDAASALNNDGVSPDEFLLGLSGIVAECLATTLLVAHLIERDWEELVFTA